MTRFYTMLNAEKITTGLQLKIHILLLKKKKDIGIQENHILLSTLVLHHTPTTQQKHALKQTGTVLQLLFHEFSDGGWTVMWEKCSIGPTRLSGRESLCYVMLRGKTTQKY